MENGLNVEFSHILPQNKGCKMAILTVLEKSFSTEISRTIKQGPLNRERDANK
jgi:hypothetical protein